MCSQLYLIKVSCWGQTCNRKMKDKIYILAGGSLNSNIIPNHGNNMCRPYKSETVRLQSFDAEGKIRCNAILYSKRKELAAAGFYYNGIRNDLVHCMYCGMMLNGWQITDNPWIEHAIGNKKCGFLKSVKGNGFIDEIHQKLLVETDIDTDERIWTYYMLSNKEYRIRKEEETSNREIADDKLCTICLSGYRDNVFLPCSHLGACKGCAPLFRECFICRTKITGIMKIYNV